MHPQILQDASKSSLSHIPLSPRSTSSAQSSKLLSQASLVEGRISTASNQSSRPSPISILKNRLLSPSEKKERENPSLPRLNLSHNLTLEKPKSYSNRQETVKIFKTKMDSIKEVEDSIQNQGKEKKSVVSSQIKKDDTIKTINLMFEQKVKDYTLKKSKKIKGSMYINDLWSNDYEQNVMKAVEIDKELQNEIKASRRSFKDKLPVLAANFEKRMKSQEVKGSLKEVWDQKSVDLPGLQDKSIWGDSGNRIQTEPDHSFQNITSPQRKLSAFSKRTSHLPKHMTNELEIKERFNSEPDAQMIEAMKGKHKPFLLGIEDSPTSMDTSQQGFGRNRNKHHRFLHIASTIASNSPSARKTPYSIFSTPTNKLITSAKTSKSPRVRGFETTHTLFKRKSSFPQASKLIFPSERRRVFLEESNGKVGELIEKCNTELDEGPECLDMIDELGKMLQKKKRNIGKANFMKDKKERVIENCKYMLGKREKTK